MSGATGGGTAGRVQAAIRVLLLVAGTGVAAGVVGAVMAVALLLIEAATYGHGGASMMQEVAAASEVRRIAGPLVGGVLAGLGWWWLRSRGRVRTVEEVLGEDGRRLPVRRTLADAGLQLLVVGSGASIGREGAPRQAAAAIADALAARLGVSSELRRTVVAAAAGAGLAAVYNVPLAGAIFAVETLPGRRNLRAVLVAVATAGIATVTAWPVVTNEPTYRFPDVPMARQTLLVASAWVLVCIPAAAAVGAAFHRLARRARDYRPGPGWRLPVFIGGASALVGAASIGLPSLPGNGKDILQLAYSGQGGLALFAVLLVVKPLATAMCLRSGAVGGLLTPALATGGALGALAATAIPPHTPGVDMPVFALVGAAAVLAVTQRAPLFGAVMAWELARAPLWTVPLLLAVAFGSRHLARALGRRGWSLRIPGRAVEEPPVG